MKLTFRLRLLIWYLKLSYAFRRWRYDLKWLLKGRVARERRKRDREKALDELAQMSQDLGLYE